ncbi:MAG: roadblock/LC7 domain-containing protein [Zetaproteobacteria bacterium]|nr:MAG: roadblock/LC7 domain-containing protein [Zetaproteobacteria bacterium]
MDGPWGDLFLFAEDEQRLVGLLTRLCADAKARAAFLVDRNGRLLAEAGESAGLDTTSLASLVAGSIAATGGLARLVGERAFSGLFHEGERSHLYVTVLGDGLILVVSFDRNSSAGLVRFRVRRASEEIGQAFAEVTGRVAGAQSELAQITDEDIENLPSS